MRPIPTLKISISGVRGVIGDSLTPAMLTRFAQAFGTYIGSGTVVIGRDPRTSGEMVKQAVIAGLLSSGCRVTDIGMCPVPTIQLLVRRNHALGGEVLPINVTPSGLFPRPAEPLPENLGDLCAAVTEQHADIGFAQDMDADRLAIVSEQGMPIGEDYTLVLATLYVLGKEPGA